MGAWQKEAQLRCVTETGKTTATMAAFSSDPADLKPLRQHKHIPPRLTAPASEIEQAAALIAEQVAKKARS